MIIKLIHAGYGNYIAAGRIVTVVTPHSASIKRMIRAEKEKGKVIDLTEGRRTKSVIFTDASYLVLSSLEPVTLNGRIETCGKE